MPEPAWVVFVRSREDGPLVVTIDMALRDAAPIAASPWLTVVDVPLLHPTAAGLHAAPEGEELGAFVDDVVRRRGGEGDLVAQAVGSSRKRYLFQTADRDGVAEAARAAAARLAGREVSVVTDRDAEWSAYRELLPTRREEWSIRNRQLIATLREEGDRLTRPRPVLHWAYFPDEASRERAAVDLVSQGFRMEGRVRADKRFGELRYGLRFARDETPTLDAAEEFVDVATDLCKSAGGEYDGWETQVLAPKSGK